ncbi:uncharacterized protein B0H18DRAFT_1147352, partial [Fomitopsis serialis]|uniref:uncharacterized protein n=1 Tax=Fomitopsis serialis TaxID=139415 RepID=UPI00200846F4
YVVRALTGYPTSAPAQALADVVRVDLTVPTDVHEALQGCWGVFGVTNFYDPKIKDDPESEERQGKNLVDAALAAGKYHVTQYIQETGLPATFLYTGNFYENMVYRSHMVYHRDKDQVEFLQPIVSVAMLYVEKNLSAITKAVLDHWGDEPCGAEPQVPLLCQRAALRSIIAIAPSITGTPCACTILMTTHVPDRDIMLHLYNEMGMYGTKEIPDENVLKLGVRLHDIDNFVRSRLTLHLGLSVVV